MSRWWAILPILVIAAVPISTAFSASVIAIEALACLFCAIAIYRPILGLVTAGCGLAIFGYAVALWLADQGTDVVGAGVFGLALLFLFDLSEFARRFRGADIADAVVRGQIGYWLGRAAIIAAGIAVLTLGGSALALLVPGEGRPVIVGLGAIIAFAGALRSGIARTDT